MHRYDTTAVAFKTDSKGQQRGATEDTVREGSQKLETFREPSDLHVFHGLPVVKTMRNHTAPATMPDFMGDLFASERDKLHYDKHQIQTITPIALNELTQALDDMKKGKCRDKAGVVLEMVLQGGDLLRTCLTGLYNDMLRSGDFGSDWHETFFALLPKSGDLSDPANWRPIAILRVCYKIFARILYNRLRTTLEPQFSDEQMGFMPCRGPDDALLILESVIHKSIDHDVPLWFASLDLRKAFDRIEWDQLFIALGEMNVPTAYQHLLAMLYDGKTGTLGDKARFDIKRGVRQGDVLSPMLFNAACDVVIKRWKQKLNGRGIKLGSETETLTNIRFADDLIIYAGSLPELVEMIDLLAAELAHAGLDLNAKKSRIFTTDADASLSESPQLVEVAGGFVEVVRGSDTHKYLGNAFPGDLCRRGRSMLMNRMRCAWAKFHLYRQTLVNKRVHLKLRLRLFKSVVASSALYGLSTAPLTQKHFDYLASTQRKMLRTIVGHVGLVDDDWADYHRRMNDKIATALRQAPVPFGDELLIDRKASLKMKLKLQSTGAAGLRMGSCTHTLPGKAENQMGSMC